MGLWALTSAEIQGSGHKKKNIPCQDKTFCLERNKTKVIALADGAGSAPLSHFGAEEVTKCVANYIADNFDDLFCMEGCDAHAVIASLLRNFLDNLSARYDCDVRDLSSTLLVVAVKKRRYISVHIGDGVIGCLYCDKLMILSEPDNGEFAHLTWFTTTSILEDVIRINRGDATSMSGFILMSDGVEPSLYDGKRNQLADAVMNLFYCNAKYPKGEMTSMLEKSLCEVISMRTHDDCSIALLSRTRYKNYDEYAKYRKRIKKRNRKQKA